MPPEASSTRTRRIRRSSSFGASAAGDITACTCSPDEEDDYVVTIRRGATVLYEGKRQSTNFGPTRIELSLVDLDGDGHREIVAADFAGLSNGMTVSYWNLTIVDGRTNAATSMPLVEYGDGVIRGHTVLITAWEWMADHLYFVAR